MANDDLHLIIRFSNDLSGSLRYVAVGSTMEAVTSNFVFLIVFIRNTVGVKQHPAWSDEKRYQIQLPSVRLA